MGDIALIGSWSFGRIPECDRIPPGQALISLNEATEGSGYGPRPKRFETTHLQAAQVRKGCVQPKAQLFAFHDSGRLLYIWMMFGRDLPTAVRTKTEAIASTLTVRPRS